MIEIIYFFVIVSANTIGAVSGMGGGVIIKPVLDFIHADSPAAISFYSSVAVFTMSIVSTWKQVKSGFKLQWNTLIWLAGGAVIGGVLGNTTFEYFLKLFSEEKSVQFIQISLTIATLCLAYMYTKYSTKTFHFQQRSWYTLCGGILGFLASFLGIGGGPINVSLLIFLFGFSIKEATVYSIGIIFFSQCSKLLTIAVTIGFDRYDLSMLFVVIPAAIIGGFLGAKLSVRLAPKQVANCFQAIIFLVLLINLYNGFQLLTP